MSNKDKIQALKSQYLCERMTAVMDIHSLLNGNSIPEHSSYSAELRGLLAKVDEITGLIEACEFLDRTLSTPTEAREKTGD